MSMSTPEINHLGGLKTVMKKVGIAVRVVLIRVSLPR
jgi:hypothetical protein